MIDCADSIMSLAFSPDGSRIAACSSDATVQLWNFVTGELEKELIDDTHGAKFVAFSADGSQVVFGSVDFIVRVWNLTIGESRLLSTSVILPDQSVVQYQPSIPHFTISDDQSVTPRPLFSFSEDRRWLTISSAKSRYWIPPSYSVLNSYKFFANRAILAYSSGKLLILADK
ncbi:hypothetical protein DL96DRAFT_1621438 [Flagelloscypha sp. PMI_526]|nr:hypothetical protein DL96DRAFT_1621438 [Flagelloscypha sp. PMI_526]